MGLAAPSIELDEAERGLTRRPGHQMVQFVRVALYPSASAPTHLVLTMACTRAERRSGLGVPQLDRNVRAHTGAIPASVLACRISDSRRLIRARGGSCNVGHVCLAPPARIFTALKFADNRLQRQTSQDTHAMHPTAAVCEAEQLLFGMSRLRQLPETGFGEDCGGGGQQAAIRTNAREPDHPLPMDPALFFPQKGVGADQGFCGGRLAACDPDLPCADPLKAHPGPPPHILIDLLGGWRPKEPSVVQDLLRDAVNGGASRGNAA